MTELEDRIIAFTAKERGMKPNRISLSSRLNHDLGMDGDDAIEFFEKFSKDFEVDVGELKEHWSDHFGPEGTGVPLGALAVIGISVVLGDLLHRFIQWGPIWAWMIALMFVFGWGYLKFLTDHGHDGIMPVTVEDLVIAAKTGTWVKHDKGDDNTHMFRMLD
jgi:hypothetical protein